MAAYDHYPPLELESNAQTRTVAFAANGDYLLSGHYEMVRVWRMENGEEMSARIAARGVSCFAVSKDGRFIAAGTSSGDLEVIAWDAKTYQKAFTLEKLGDRIIGVDFSPDSARVLVTSESDSDSVPGTTTVWNIATRLRELTLHHGKRWASAANTPRGVIESLQPLLIPFASGIATMVACSRTSQ